ncbi:MAG: hypothetical protein NZM37_03995 [Sandaracinaceae bacterium]|nr:hypothetical protein [Sandaracinaceae bacterium]
MRLGRRKSQACFALEGARVTHRLIGLALAIVAYAESGCSGCEQFGMSPIPGGFPTEQPRVANAGQIRITESGVQLIENNIARIVELVNGGPIEFPIPRTEEGLPLSARAIICPANDCRARAEVRSLDIIPTPPNQLRAVLQVRVDSRDAGGVRRNIPVEVRHLWTTRINVDVDTRRGSRDFVALEALITLRGETRDPRNGFTRIDVGEARLVMGQDIENDDITTSGSGLDGAILSGLINLFKRQLIDRLQGQVSRVLNSAIGNLFCARQGMHGCPRGTSPDGSGPDAICRFSGSMDCVPLLLGVEGQGDVGDRFLGAFSPGTRGPLMGILAAGGDGVAMNNGLSLYATGGLLSFDRNFTRTPAHNPCVPRVEPPSPPDIRRVSAFQGNVIPGTSTPYQLGIGVSEDFLNYAGYAIFDSGMLCLGVGTRLSQQLTTGLVSVLIPTLRALAYPLPAAPLSVATRPQRPPIFEVGTRSGEPLLTMTIPNLQVDFYVWSQERYIRFMTYQTDLQIAVDLMAMGNRLVPQVTAVNPRNSRVLNSEILVENPASLAMTLETVIRMFAGMLTGRLPSFEIPPFDLNRDGTPDILIDIPSGGVRAISDEGEDFLAVFANFELGGAPRPLIRPIDTKMEVMVYTLVRESMSLENFGQNGLNSVGLRIWAEGPQGVDYEYSYRIDGGPWSPWIMGGRLADVNDCESSFLCFERGEAVIIEDPILLLQARHVIETRVRIAGEPKTVDLTPASAELIIDILPPFVKIEPRHRVNGIHVIADDIITPPDRLEMRIRFDEGDWSDWMPLSDQDIPENARMVEVEVRDEAWNVGRATMPLIRGIPDPGRTGAGCGCKVSAPNGRRSALVVLAIALVALVRRRKGGGRFSGPFFSVLTGFLALSLIGCDCEARPIPRDARADMGPSGCTEVCTPADPPGNPMGTVCCPARGMCVSYSVEAICGSGQNCSPQNLSVDSNCNVQCTRCEPLPPLQPGLLATHLDMVVDGMTTYISGYSPGVPAGNSYGDLVFGVAMSPGDNPMIRWEIVDGVPRGARVTADPNGWRGGVAEPGDDVGRWTAMVRNSGGTFYIAYYDATNTALKIAIGRPGNWSVHTIDAQGDSGRYASITLDAMGRPVVSYLRIDAMPDSGRVRSAVRVAHASTPMPSSASDWRLVEVSGKETPCRPEYCPMGQMCLASGRCAMPSSTCSPACGMGKACVGGRCEDVLPNPYVEDLYPGRGLYTQIATTRNGLALIFYDRSEGNLYGARHDGSSWSAPFLIDGYGRRGGGDSGISASLVVDEMGRWHIAYVDATDEVLRYARVDGGDVAVREVVDDGTTDGMNPHPDGRHIVGDDASIVVTSSGEIRIAYQDATAHRLRLARRMGDRWMIQVLDSRDHTGFWVEQAVAPMGSRVVSWWRKEMRGMTQNGIRIFQVN